MKRLFLTAAVAVMAAVSASAQGVSWRKTDDHAARRNSVTTFGSVQGWGSYESHGFGHLGLEYDRTLPILNLSVSAIGLYAPMNGNMISDAYAQEETFTFAGVKLNCNLPVVRNLLYFRMGVGGGMGWHRTTGYQTGELSSRPAPAFDTYVRPHLVVDAYWVLRVSRWLDLRFSPLLVSPSQLIVGGRFDAPRNDHMFLYVNMGTFGATVRF